MWMTNEHGLYMSNSIFMFKSQMNFFLKIKLVFKNRFGLAIGPEPWLLVLKII